MLGESGELIENIFLRPRMFCDTENLRELLFFVAGVRCGQSPPHGSGCLPGIEDYVREKFRAARGESWTRVLLREFEDLPYLEACRAIADLLREWRKTEER